MTSQIAKIRISPIRGPLPSEIFRNEAWVHTLTVRFFGAVCASCLELIRAMDTLRLVCHRLVVAHATVFTLIIQPFLSSRTVCCKLTCQLFIHWGLNLFYDTKVVLGLCAISALVGWPWACWSRSTVLTKVIALLFQMLCFQCRSFCGWCQKQWPICNSGYFCII